MRSVLAGSVGEGRSSETSLTSVCRDLHDQAVAPTVLGIRLCFDFARELWLARVVDDSRRRVELLSAPIADADAHTGIGSNVPHPVCTIAMLGDHVEAIAALGEPDLDLARE